MSDRTFKFKKLKNIFFILSTLCYIGVALVTTILVLSRVSDRSFIDLFSEDIKAKLLALGVTAIIGIIVALFIKEKARTTLYMLSFVMITLLTGEVGMYSVLGVWAVDEYIFSNLYKSFKNKYIINKEIDKR